ncbi:MAG: hypothetical protein RL026_2714 [Pseudomonadota bacterium]|jgi:cyclohexanone monooxygenase
MAQSQFDPDLDAVVVGAGFAGLYMLYRLRGLGLRARVFEAGGGVGGTWYWNSYPGARCDIESMEYSYQFDEALQQEWVWSERYATGPEILRYLNHVADRYNLRKDIQFNTRVTGAVHDDASGLWKVGLSDGSTLTSRYCIMATGCLSAANLPDIPGRDSFAGKIVHTGNWPRDGIDFSGKRVAVIGTGSSGIQVIPEIARTAAHLTVFQRTASYSIPARNAVLDPEVQAEVKRGYKAMRQRVALMPIGAEFFHRDVSALAEPAEARLAVMEERWQRGGTSFGAAFNDLMVNEDANKIAADFVRDKIRSTVKDPATAEALLPKHLFGIKRICLDSDYYATYNRPNVSLVAMQGRSIERIVPEGLVFDGKTHAVDIIVFATGFDAMTGTLLRMDIRGRNGLTLGQKWAAGPKTYLGIQTQGFPNLFMVTGPGSPSVFTNVVPSIEQDVNFIAGAIGHLQGQGLHEMEATTEAEEGWVKEVAAIADSTLYTKGNSWYLGSNIPGKARVFLAWIGFPTYVERCRQVVARGYEGFRCQ